MATVMTLVDKRTFVSQRDRNGIVPAWHNFSQPRRPHNIPYKKND